MIDLYVIIFCGKIIQRGNQFGPCNRISNQQNSLMKVKITVNGYYSFIRRKLDYKSGNLRYYFCFSLNLINKMSFIRESVYVCQDNIMPFKFFCVYKALKKLNIYK